jgi:hypothetical protein
MIKWLNHDVTDFKLSEWFKFDVGPILGCWHRVWAVLPTFRGNMLPPSPGSKWVVLVFGLCTWAVPWTQWGRGGAGARSCLLGMEIDGLCSVAIYRFRRRRRILLASGNTSTCLSSSAGVWALGMPAGTLESDDGFFRPISDWRAHKGA